MNKYKKLTMYLLFLGVFCVLTGVTYSFFNYTRTGGENTVRVGNLSFNSINGTAMNISNVFPIAQADINTLTDYVGSVTINVTGSTNYSKGIEYAVSVVDLNNRFLGIGIFKEVPLSVDVSYSNNGSGTTIGTANDNYFNEGVRGGNTSYYKVVAPRTVEENDKLVVGYIAPGNTGIDGNIVIKAYIDEEFVAISDSYPPGNIYKVNPDMTQEGLNACVQIMTAQGANQALLPGETIASFCNGTGTIGGHYFQEILNASEADSQGIQYFLSHDTIVFSHVNSSTLEWLGDRHLFTTSLWNSIQNTGLSFKIKVEANDGIWVEEPGKIDACPGCKFIYSNNLQIPMTTNIYNAPAIPITSGLSDSYLDIVRSSTKKHFLGVILNENNQVVRGFACGLVDNTPFCIEGADGTSTYSAKVAYLQSENLFDSYCDDYDSTYNNQTPYHGTYCGYTDYFDIYGEVHDSGSAITYEDYTDRRGYCGVYPGGIIECGEEPYN